MNPIQPNNEILNVQNSEALNQNEVPAFLSRHIIPEVWGALTYEQRELLVNIDSLPNVLNGVVPESVWGTLTLQQKLEFLFSHALLPRFEVSPLSEIRPEMDQFIESVEPATESTPTGEVLVNERSEVENEFQQAKERFNEVERVANQDEQEQVPEQQLSAEEVERIRSESGATFNEPSMPKFSGYAPSATLMQNYAQISDGDTNKGDTWTATLIKKIMFAIGNRE